MKDRNEQFRPSYAFVDRFVDGGYTHLCKPTYRDVDSALEKAWNGKGGFTVEEAVGLSTFLCGGVKGILNGNEVSVSDLYMEDYWKVKKLIG